MTSCVLGACSLGFAGAGSCECEQDIRCVGANDGPRCVGDAADGAGYCGCTVDSDCTPRTCVTFTVVRYQDIVDTLSVRTSFTH
jgi:hypothetical protein